ncbi:MAG: SDR family oxidoreductase [Candidatus Ozemobacteraceae bacterium]
MKMSFNNKVVIITGGSRGLGKKLAVRFSKLNANVILLDKDEAGGNIVVNDIKAMNKKAEFVKVDLTKDGDFSKTINIIKGKFGKIDVLINNARGRGSKNPPLIEKASDWEDMFKIALKEPFYAAIEFIKAAEGAKTKSCILNISSVAASFIGHESPSYHMTKASLEAMTKYLAVFGGAKGVRVNAIRPGFIVQDEHAAKYLHNNNLSYKRLAEFSHPVNRVGSSDDIADAAIFLCSSKAEFITGQILTIDGGLTIQDPWDLLFSFAKARNLL